MQVFHPTFLGSWGVFGNVEDFFGDVGEFLRMLEYGWNYPARPTCTVEITPHALKGQKLLAQGIALGYFVRKPVAL